MHTAKPPIVLFGCFRRLHRTGLRTWSMLRCWGLRALGRPVFPLLVVAGGAFRPACASGRPAGALIPAALLARGPSLPGLLCVFALAARRASFPLRGTLPAFRPLAALLRRALLALLRRLFAALARICLPLGPLLHRTLLALRLLQLFFHRVEHRFQHNDLLGNLQLRVRLLLFRSALPAQQLHLLHMEGLRRRPPAQNPGAPANFR